MLIEGPIYVVWHGGSSYAAPHIPEDVERFDTLEDACIEADNRMRCGATFANTFRYINKPEENVLTPVVGTDSRMEVFLADPSDVIDHLPDFEIGYVEEIDEFVSVDYLGDRLYLEVPGE